MPHVLVAGASGLVGHAAVEQFAAMPGWRVTGVSRRIPPAVANATFISVDLLDSDACRRAFGAMHDVTHLVYAALQEAPGLFAGWLDESLMQRNAAMLRNLFEPLAAAAPIEHISLLHGTKAYGIHHPSIGMAGARIPLREREPRREHPNFYFLQEDYLRDRQRAASWSMTVWRPTVIYGDASGANMNPILPIAAYAAILREQGRPLDFPGTGPGAAVREAVDARLVARALAWAATAPSAAGRTFNITNGDVFTWENAWPAIANALGMQPGETRPTALAEFLPAHDAEWSAIVQRHQLDAPRSAVDFAGQNSLVYADAMLAAPRNPGPPILNSTIALRQAGFHDCLDTEDMFREIFTNLRAAKKFPA